MFSSCLPTLDMDLDGPSRRSDSPNCMDRVPRPDRTDWPDRSEWSDRLERSDRSERAADRPDRIDWSERNDWNDRSEQSERNSRLERSERNDRDRSYRPDRTDRSDRGERTGWTNDWKRERRGFDESCDQENIQIYKTDSGSKRNSDNSSKEKLFAQKSENHVEAPSRMSDSKVNGLSSVSDTRARSNNSSLDRDRLSTVVASKDRLSPLPRPRNAGREGYGSFEPETLVDSRTNMKQHPNREMPNTMSRRPGDEVRDGRDSRDRVLSQTSSSRAQGGHQDNYERDQTGAGAHSRLNVGQDRQSMEETNHYTYPEFLKEYTEIRNTEQRRQYKADFNKDYREYQTLHQLVERVSQHFAQLEKRLRQEPEGSDGYKRIKDQIVQEYYSNKKDAKLNESKKRFQYLHDKLSHIKRLVHEYDTSIQKGGGGAES